MDYKEVLENQIRVLQEVQDSLSGRARSLEYVELSKQIQSLTESLIDRSLTLK